MFYSVMLLSVRCNQLQQVRFLVASVGIGHIVLGPPRTFPECGTCSKTRIGNCLGQDVVHVGDAQAKAHKEEEVATCVAKFGREMDPPIKSHMAEPQDGMK